MKRMSEPSIQQMLRDIDGRLFALETVLKRLLLHAKREVFTDIRRDVHELFLDDTAYARIRFERTMALIREAERRQSNSDN